MGQYHRHVAGNSSAMRMSVDHDRRSVPQICLPKGHSVCAALGRKHQNIRAYIFYCC